MCVVLQITKLKIDSNPFAKGFRDSSRLTDFERWVRGRGWVARNISKVGRESTLLRISGWRGT